MSDKHSRPPGVTESAQRLAVALDAAGCEYAFAGAIALGFGQRARHARRRRHAVSTATATIDMCANSARHECCGISFGIAADFAVFAVSDVILGHRERLVL